VNGVSTACRPAIALLLALLSGTAASAQSIQAGVKGGVNFATVTFEGEPDATSGHWFGVVGAFVVMPVHGGVSLQPEVLYTRKGAQLRGAGAQPTLLLDYLEVPVLARVSTNAFGTKVFFVGGPAVAWRVRARTRTKFSGATEEVDISDQLRRLDFGIVGGAGVELESLFIDGRYTLGLTDINKDSTDAARAVNRAVSVTVGWRF
jgi:hypothetical protein